MPAAGHPNHDGGLLRAQCSRAARPLAKCGGAPLAYAMLLASLAALSAVLHAEEFGTIPGTIGSTPGTGARPESPDWNTMHQDPFRA